MKHITIGDNALYFSILRDSPYFQPTTNYYALKVRSMDTSVEKTVLLRDVSAAPSSYQHFLLTGSTSTDVLSAATISMRPYGMFYASIYPVSGSTLSEVDASQELWTGLIYSKES
jgi:hypothetical protein